MLSMIELNREEMDQLDSSYEFFIFQQYEFMSETSFFFLPFIREIFWTLERYRCRISCNTIMV